MVAVGAPDYFKRHPAPKIPADLAAHDYVRYRLTSRNAIYRWSFTEPGASSRDFKIEPQGRFTTNDDDTMRRAVLNGLGLIQHIDLAVQPHLDRGELVEVLGRWCPPFSGFHLYIPSRAQMPARMRAFIDFMVEKRAEFEHVSRAGH
jgi:DNA-binding transcriptional LysR family regulator